MKKMANLFTLLIFLWTSFLTPISYAQTSEMWTSNIPTYEGLQKEEWKDILEPDNTVDENSENSIQSTEETPDDSQNLQIENGEMNIALQDSPQRSWTMFIPWEEFNLRLKNLANDNYNYAYNNNRNITSFKKSSTPAPLWVTTTWLATDDSEYEIIAWYDDWAIYYYTEANKIYLNPNSRFMFWWMVSLTNIDTASWDTSKVIDMSEMFRNDASLTNLNVSRWDTSKVVDMSEMFDWCIVLKKLDVDNWDTSNVEDMYRMFASDFTLTNLDLSRWNTSNVTNMRQMFCNDLSLTNLDVSRWNTSNVTNMGWMFIWCINLTKLDLSRWNTNNVEDMSRMFYQCDSLETIYVSDKFELDNANQWYEMFHGNYNLIWWNGTKFESNHTDYDYANIDTAQNPWYFSNISGNTVIVRFFTNGWSDVDVQVVNKWDTIESVQSSKDNAVFKWWYTDEWLTRNFNTSTAVNSNLKLYAKWECKPWYYNNKWICIEENKKIEYKWWIIKITDGETTVYIKDRNQWATESRWSTLIHKLLNPVLQKVKEWQPFLYGWLYNYVSKELSNIAWVDMFTVWELVDHYDGDVIKLLKDFKLKYEAWKYTSSYGNYYYWWNDVGVSYSDLWLWDLTWSINIFTGREIPYEITDETTNVLIENLLNLFVANISESAIERWFTGWKIWMEWEWWTQWNSNPCDPSKWEYLPRLDDWINLMQVRWNINWREVVKTQLWEGSWEVYVFGSWLDNLVNWMSNSPMELLELLNLEMDEDLMIPWAWWVIKAEDIASLVKMILMMRWANEGMIDSIIEHVIDDLWVKYIYLPLLSPLRVASDSWDAVWIYIWEAGIISVTNDIWHYANNFAAPVRCFVDESAWPKDEEKEENKYSGWWGWRWGSNSKSDTEADTHWTANEQKDIKNDKKNGDDQDNSQKNTQNENKSETLAPQDYQWNKWSNFASNEFQKAYNFAHSYGITTKKSVESAKMNSSLTRIQMAKMLSNYAINVMWKYPDISKWVIKFDDVTNKMNKEYDNWVNLAYQLWIMWQNMPWNKFRPKDEVTRAEFITALSRLLYSTSDWEYKWTWKYYIHHMQKLKSEWIITNENPNMTEKRWNVMIMLMRSAK